MKKFKSEINEYCQKHNLIVEYITLKNNNEFISKLCIKGIKDNFIGNGLNIKSAEENASEKAYNYISKMKIETKIYDPNSIKLLMIDLENCAGEFFKNVDKVKDWNILGFSKKNLFLDFKYPIIRTESTRKDASDIAIIIKLSEYLRENKYSQIVILSRDHFAETTIECFNDKNLWQYGDSVKDNKNYTKIKCIKMIDELF